MQCTFELASIDGYVSGTFLFHFDEENTSLFFG